MSEPAYECWRADSRGSVCSISSVPVAGLRSAAKRVGLLLRVSLVLLASAQLHAVVAQERVARLQVGVAKAVPGSQARIGLMLFLPDAGPRPQTVATKICLADSFVRFLEVEPGPAARSAHTRIQKKVDRTQESTCVTLEFAFEGSAATGTLAELLFELGPDAPLGQVIGLKAEGRLVGTQGSIEASVQSGSITISEIDPIFGCFFYMH